MNIPEVRKLQRKNRKNPTLADVKRLKDGFDGLAEQKKIRLSTGYNLGSFAWSDGRAQISYNMRNGDINVHGSEEGRRGHWWMLPCETFDSVDDAYWAIIDVRSSGELDEVIDNGDDEEAG